MTWAHEFLRSSQAGGGAQHKARRNRIPIHVYKDWRGAVLWELGAEFAVIRLLLEANIVGDLLAPIALVPAGLGVGAPLVARVEGDGAESYQIAELRGSYWAGSGRPGSDEAGAVARGEVFFGCIPQDLGWEPYYSDRGASE